MDGLSRRKDRWTDSWMKGQKDGCPEGRMMDSWIDGLKVHERMDGWNGWMNGQTDP